MNKTQASVNNALKNRAAKAPAKANQNKGLRGLVEQMGPRIKNALVGQALQPERFTSIILTELSKNPKLAECEPTSFLAAMMQSAQLGLEPNTQGQAYLIPYKNNRKGVTECQFQIGYKGLIDLAYKCSGMLVSAEVVYENDDFSCEYGLHRDLHHIPADGDRGKPIKYYATYKMPNGMTDFKVLSKDDVEKHAKRFSKSYNSGPWKDNFEAMALKTAIKQLLKYAPMSGTLISSAVNADETTKRIEINDDINVLDLRPEYDVMDYEIDPDTGEVIEENLSEKDEKIANLKAELGQQKF